MADAASWNWSVRRLQRCDLQLCCDLSHIGPMDTVAESWSGFYKVLYVLADQLSGWYKELNSLP